MIMSNLLEAATKFLTILAKCPRSQSGAGGQTVDACLARTVINRVPLRAVQEFEQAVSFRTSDPPHECVYAIGCEHKPGEFGMWHGPNPSLQHMLEVTPIETQPNSVILKLEGESSLVVYRWQDMKWVPEQC